MEVALEVILMMNSISAIISALKIILMKPIVKIATLYFQIEWLSAVQLFV